MPFSEAFLDYLEKLAIQYQKELNVLESDPINKTFNFAKQLTHVGVKTREDWIEKVLPEMWDVKILEADFNDVAKGGKEGTKVVFGRLTVEVPHVDFGTFWFLLASGGAGGGGGGGGRSRSRSRGGRIAPST